MAIKKRITQFKNAEIDVKSMTITEVSKNYMETFDLQEVLKSWNGVPGVTLIIASTEQIYPCE